MKLRWIYRIPPKWRARVLRAGFNLHPGFRSMGGKVIEVTPDLSAMKIRLPLHWRTRNALGSIFGGSLFGVTDGPHPLLLMVSLGEDVIVWDKQASIRFRRPAYCTLYTWCRVTAEDKDRIQSALEEHQEVTHDFVISLEDQAGEVYAIVERTLYIAHRRHYSQKKKAQSERKQEG
ncbi:DUF4442 domain-containing protein [Paenalcaligenes hermetiae]|uniref:DUF4442 domain-containing protein n=1 Tax=Paenalcaligenes hermetiae TaxID=1157987 RepID=UPI0031F04528